MSNNHDPRGIKRYQQQYEVAGSPELRAYLTLDPSDGWWEAVLETDEGCLFLTSYETRHEAVQALREEIEAAKQGGQQ